MCLESRCDLALLQADYILFRIKSAIIPYLTAAASGQGNLFAYTAVNRGIMLWPESSFGTNSNKMFYFDSI